MQQRSQLLTVTALSLTLLLQSCSLQKKAQCNTLIENVNKINSVWQKSAALKPTSQKAPKTQAEFNQLAITTTAPLLGILQEVDVLLSQLQGQEINDKLISVYQNNLLFIHIQRSNILRKGVNSIRTLAPGADIPEMALRSGGSMSESAPSNDSSSTPEERKAAHIRELGDKARNNMNQQFTMLSGDPSPAERARRRKNEMAQMTQALGFLKNMKTLDEEIKPQELSIMRRVSASCDIPMPKTE
jgi:hypothetical protein